MNRTIYYKNTPSIIAVSSSGGPKEVEGSVGSFIENKFYDDMLGEKTFEKAESKMLYLTIDKAISNSGLKSDEIDAIISGDLVNQITSSSFAARNFSTGFLGVYNACASFVNALIYGATLIDGNYLENVVCSSSSHFSTAERQYRYPLELGSTRPPQSQWTVTGAGACVLSKKDGIKITTATVGKIVDYGVTDVNNMGAAMAVSACDTLCTHFKNTGTTPSDYDLILSGDLGTLGSRLLKDLTFEKGYDIEQNHVDCGELIYNINEKEYQGGSGAGCSSCVFCSYVYRRMMEKKFKRVILMATGALLSSTSSLQGESIPGISHLITLEIQ